MNDVGVALAPTYHTPVSIIVLAILAALCIGVVVIDARLRRHPRNEITPENPEDSGRIRVDLTKR